MASIIRNPPFLHPHSKSSSPSPSRIQIPVRKCILPSRFSPLSIDLMQPLQPPSASCFPPFSYLTSLPSLAAAPGEITETEEDVQQHQPPFTNNLEDSEDEMQVDECADYGTVIDLDGKTESTLMSLLESFKEALENNDQSKVTEIESCLLSMENEKESLAKKMSQLSEELTVEEDRILRISSDFDNFRKMAEKARLYVISVQGEVVKKFLPVLDFFGRAEASIKIETEGEEKIKNSYQNICEQLLEVLASFGVEAVGNTAGRMIDPMVHEAIVQVYSTEFEKGIILEDWGKGYKLCEKLLRPGLVKISAGPGPAKPVEEASPDEEGDNGHNGETSTKDDGGESA